jgi:tripartite motif-containing protein 71
VSIQAVTPSITMRYVKTIGIVNNGFNGRGFANPYDLAVSQDGRIFVLNRCDPTRAAAIRVGICTLDEEYLGEFGNGFGSGDGQFIWPVAMAFDRRERLYITDEQNHRISIFDTSGTFLGK